ncbi:hypothetical protein BT63DRAFT_378157 [Microthyrium microscopicum]|uniref:Rhodanese domain-containing protein n=1 Tax=Microthyrium microscopicum TaxID=703497 RepID=A0A6A6U2A7_9PEZI|nr:hypothetical protein BT63DRAFT_378157 [Microthyrium microscopicum]
MTSIPLDSPWDPNYPIARNQNPASLTRHDILSILSSGQKPGEDFILIDLRREDHIGGAIQGSINIPAQTLYPTIPALYSLFSNAGVKSVVWFCGSSQHRGFRAAAWFDDYIQSRGNEEMRSFRLHEGIKGWATGGAEFTQRMDGYVKEAWD